MHPEERKALARLAYEVINHRDLSKLDGHPGYWETQQVFPLLFQAFPDLSATIEQQTIDGEWVTTRATLRGSHRGAFARMVPTGKSFEIMHIALDQVTAEGKLVEHFAVADWRKLFRPSEAKAQPNSISSET